MALIFQWALLFRRSEYISINCSRVSSIVEELSITKWAWAHFFSIGIWASIRTRASFSDSLFLSINLWSSKSFSLQTKYMQMQTNAKMFSLFGIIMFCCISYTHTRQLQWFYIGILSTNWPQIARACRSQRIDDLVNKKAMWFFNW